MLKLKASLEAVKTRKNVTDDIVQTIVFNIFGDAKEIGELNEFYRKPLIITIEETEGNNEG